MTEPIEAVNRLLTHFMQTLRSYLTEGGDPEPVDKWIAAGIAGVAAVLMVWPRDRKMPWLVDLLIKISKRVWSIAKDAA